MLTYAPRERTRPTSHTEDWPCTIIRRLLSGFEGLPPKPERPPASDPADTSTDTSTIETKLEIEPSLYWYLFAISPQAANAVVIEGLPRSPNAFRLTQFDTGGFAVYSHFKDEETSVRAEFLKRHGHDLGASGLASFHKWIGSEFEHSASYPEVTDKNIELWEVRCSRKDFQALDLVAIYVSESNWLALERQFEVREWRALATAFDLLVRGKVQKVGDNDDYLRKATELLTQRLEEFVNANQAPTDQNQNMNPPGAESSQRAQAVGLLSSVIGDENNIRTMRFVVQHNNGLATSAIEEFSPNLLALHADDDVTPIDGPISVGLGEVVVGVGKDVGDAIRRRFKTTRFGQALESSTATAGDGTVHLVSMSRETFASSARELAFEAAARFDRATRERTTAPLENETLDDAIRVIEASFTLSPLDRNSRVIAHRSIRRTPVPSDLLALFARRADVSTTELLGRAAENSHVPPGLVEQALGLVRKIVLFVRDLEPPEFVFRQPASLGSPEIGFRESVSLSGERAGVEEVWVELDATLTTEDRESIVAALKSPAEVGEFSVRFQTTSFPEGLLLEVVKSTGSTEVGEIEVGEIAVGQNSVTFMWPTSGTVEGLRLKR